MLTQAGLEPFDPRTDNRTPKELADIVGDAVGHKHGPIRRERLAACPNLRVIARTGIGVDAII